MRIINCDVQFSSTHYVVLWESKVIRYRTAGEGRCQKSLIKKCRKIPVSQAWHDINLK
jgi:hypothetical protein